jgi:predicted DNA-binding protein with PD1-like motif
MLEDPVLGYFDGGGYQEITQKGDFELVAMHGTIADGNVHIHLAIGNESFETRSGHLMNAKVKVQVEMVIQRLDTTRLSRVKRGNVKILGFED